LAAVFGDGESAGAEESAVERMRWFVADTLANIPLPMGTRADASQQTLWDWSHGRLDDAETINNWLRRHPDSKRPRALTWVDITDMLIATSRQRSDAAGLRALVDSEARRGCCKLPTTIERSLAAAYEIAGDESAALSAIRREQQAGGGSLSPLLLREGRIAARLGERRDAIRAYEHYLALRSNPEPRLVPQRDSAQAELNRLRADGNRGFIRWLKRWLRLPT